MAPSSSSLSSTVKFNVGGKVYEVSCSLLNRYPDTMLARMASDTWNGHDDDDATTTNNHNRKKRSADGETKPLFIERDGERFQFVLDYLRDGKILLPTTKVSPDAILAELDYFGLDNVSLDAISVRGRWSCLAMLQKMERRHQLVDACLQLARLGYATFQAENNAARIHGQLKEPATTAIFDRQICRRDICRSLTRLGFDDEQVKITLNRYLADFELECTSINVKSAELTVQQLEN
eukprot:CAMPEP_0168739602 /NCGR_PEP_ID=MMETSP0724-20121128/11548_1 /TAXON_ID=265536 /ORGANISM="Amphiprora sp., Strain CCMP467" /LENGTH=235 /DNA_ID=CAMNT_0008787011 /DNA_START=34 /DNA_END=741 /DNA_ORIENTATION=+